MPGLLHLAVAVDRAGVRDPAAYVGTVQLAERGGFDFVTLGDRAAGSVAPGPDALAVLSRAAVATRRIGLVPTLPAAHPGSVRGPAAVAELDRLSRGRAGWRTDAPAAAAADPGEPEPPGRPVCVADASDDPARAAAARYADVVLVRAAGAAQAGALRDELRARAAQYGRSPEDVRVFASLLVDLDGEYAAEPRARGGGPRPSVRGPLYRGGPVDLAELIACWHGDRAVDGFHLTPVEPLRDLERLVNGTVALLQHRALFRTFYPGGTLRDHLGLARRHAVPHATR